jgi:hypothetical protein
MIYYSFRIKIHLGTRLVSIKRTVPRTLLMALARQEKMMKITAVIQTYLIVFTGISSLKLRVPLPYELIH